MHIKITTKKGEHVINVPTNTQSLQKTIEEVKQKYPKNKYHATLVTY